MHLSILINSINSYTRFERFDSISKSAHMKPANIDNDGHQLFGIVRTLKHTISKNFQSILFYSSAHN